MSFLWLILLAAIVYAVAGRGRGRMDWSWALLLLIGLPLLAGGWMMGGGMMGGGMMGGGMMGGHHGWGGWSGTWSPWMIGGWIVGAAILGGLLYLVFKRMPAPESEARQILRLRLAKGEITSDEYDLLAKKVEE